MERGAPRQHHRPAFLQIAAAETLTISGVDAYITPLPAGWQSGYAADCKSAHSGSIPLPASKLSKLSDARDRAGASGEFDAPVVYHVMI